MDNMRRVNTRPTKYIRNFISRFFSYQRFALTSVKLTLHWRHFLLEENVPILNKTQTECPFTVFDALFSHGVNGV